MKNRGLIIGLVSVFAIIILLVFLNEKEKRALQQQLSQSQQQMTDLKRRADDLEKNQKDRQDFDRGFEVVAVKVGDTVEAMTIVSMKPFTNRRPLGNDNAIVQFKGETVIAGVWDRRAFGGDKVCMSDLSSESKARLPVQDFDTRAQWFCFDNDTMARANFGPLGASGTATVIIDDYTYISADAGVWNGARLVRVVEKVTGKPSTTPPIASKDLESLKTILEKELPGYVSPVKPNYSISIIAQNGKYIKATLLKGGEFISSYPSFYGLLSDTGWKIVFSGQEAPACSDVNTYNFPKDIVEVCFDGEREVSR